ncbi:hypothetical protein F3Y22_tig00110206pilonHSYRG00181 [Hibiscus syriacus]|uniref:Uncharacterized protein n=1 Tax=Hibiscus syriacus TaxID=106335 RepID=A0A6A3BC34_HIBSY|nr:hypothetical protein F3Y22_tig00110206pilonHSYRG00181 [Hibiscus syriacus]
MNKESLNFFGLLPSLLYLDLSLNIMEGPLTDIGIIVESKELEGAFELELPQWHYPTGFDLRIVDLSHNELHESFPGWLLENNTKLATLLLRSNSFLGEFQLPPFVMINTVMVDISSNRIHGLLVNIGKIVPHEYLDISRNAFDQEQLTSIGDMRNLQVLDLSCNNFSGEIPEELISGCGDLRILIISGNELHGQIFPQLYNLSQLRVLQLKDNYFSGDLSNVKAEGRVLGNLYLLDVGYNFMTRNIGSWIGNVTYLDIVVMQNNCFEGRFDCEGISRSLYYLDLSHNHLSESPDWFDSGGIVSNETNKHDGFFHQLLLRVDSLLFPGHQLQKDRAEKEYKFHSTAEQSVTHVEVDFLTKHRSSTYKGSILNFMSGLDLSCNNLSGPIPNALGNLSWTHALNLSYSQLTGPIPKSFSNLAQIESLDLSNNALSGEIPSSLINLDFLEVFSVAYNLSGRIPDTKAQFGMFDRRCYEGNQFLCGQPLNQNCSTESPHQLIKFVDQSKEKWYGIDAIVFYVIFSTTYIIFFLTSIIILYVNPYWRKRWFHFFENHIYYPAYDFISRIVNRVCAKLC